MEITAPNQPPIETLHTAECVSVAIIVREKHPADSDPLSSSPTPLSITCCSIDRERGEEESKSGQEGSAAVAVEVSRDFTPD